MPAISVAPLTLNAETVESGEFTIATGGLGLVNVGTITGRAADGRINTNINVLNVTDSAAVLLAENDELVLGNITTANLIDVVAGGTISADSLMSGARLDLRATSGNINLTGSNQLSGLLNFTASSGDILMNGANQLSGTVNFNAAGGIQMTGTNQLSGPLNFTASAGDIQMTGANQISGPLNFTASAGDIVMTGANTISGAINLAASTVSLVNNVDTDLAAINAATLNVTVNNANLTDSGRIVAGTAVLAANDGDITLDSPDNNFGTVDITAANNAHLVDENDLTLNQVDMSGTLITDSGSLAIGQINAATVELIARTGAITESVADAEVDITANRTQMRAATGIGELTHALSTETAELDVINDEANDNTSVINLTNTGEVLLTNLVNSGDITFENTSNVPNGRSNVTIDRIDAGYSQAEGNGELIFNVYDGNVFGIPRPNYRAVPDITANEASIYVEGNFGTQPRPIVLNIRSRGELFAQTSAYYFYGGHRPPFTDNSFETLVISNDLGLGQQLIEIESLAEIDPAIFTDVRNYYHEDLAIMMPDDQLYSDEEEERRRKLSER